MKTIGKLKLVPFENIESWSASFLFGTINKFNRKYKILKISQLLIKNNESVIIEDEKLYKRVTVKINANGVVLRDEEYGKNIGTKRQFIAKEGQMIVSKIDARNGAFGLIPSELDGAIVTNDFPLFDINHHLVNKNYLILLAKTNLFVDFAKSCSSGTTNRQRMDMDKFLTLEIPLPSLSEQETIVNNYYSKIEQAVAWEQEADTIEKSIETYLFEELEIRKETEERTKKKGLQLVEFYKMEFWGVDYNLSSSDKFFESKKFESVKLKNIVLINPITYFPDDENLSISFIPMECISDKEGKVIEQREKLIKESKGYTKFQNGDLLWARITPCMQNGKSAIVSNLKNGYGVGSTEYHVIRQKNTEVEMKYIYNVLRMNVVLQKAMSFFTGSAGQQRVPKTFLEELSIPFPPKEIQQTIINQIDTYKNEIKVLREKATLLKQQAEQEFEQTIFS